MGKTLWMEAQMPDGQDFPFPADCIDGSLHGATVVIFQEDLRTYKNVRTSRRVPHRYTIREAEKSPARASVHGVPGKSAREKEK